MRDVLYYCLELDEYSKTILRNFAKRIALKFGSDVDKFFCHHMTIAFGKEIDESVERFCEKHNGELFDIEAVQCGWNKKSCAIKVKTDCPSKNKNKHITLFTFKGGKPVDSNYIENWLDCSDCDLKIKGELKAIYR